MARNGLECGFCAGDPELVVDDAKMRTIRADIILSSEMLTRQDGKLRGAVSAGIFFEIYDVTSFFFYP